VGADPFDKKAAAAGLPPVNSVDLWPMISGQNLTSAYQRRYQWARLCCGAALCWCCDFASLACDLQCCCRL